MRTREIGLTARFGLTALCALLCMALFVATAGCGGGGGVGMGPGGVTTADAGGMWLGSGGVATPAGMLMGPMVSTLSADANGMVTGRSGAVPASATGSVITKPAGTSQLLKLTNGAFRALLILSVDRMYALYIDNAGNFAVLQRDGMAPLPVYANADIQSSQWSGTAAEVNDLVNFDPVGEETVPAVVVDAGGMFVAGTSQTNAMPLSVDNAMFGSFLGDYVDGAETGLILVVLSPDKQFGAAISCPTPAPGDIAGCDFTALRR